MTKAPQKRPEGRRPDPPPPPPPAPAVRHVLEHGAINERAPTPRPPPPIVQPIGVRPGVFLSELEERIRALEDRVEELERDVRFIKG